MKRFLLLIALVALPGICSAQISGAKNLNFSVQRQALSSPEVSLAGPAGGSKGSALSSNSPQTVTFNVKNMDESKGVSVDVGPPCHADKTPQKVGPGTYKVTLTFDTVSNTDTCSVDFRSLANNSSSEVRVWIAATQTDPGVATFEHANSILIRTDTGQTIQGAVQTRQIPPGANMGMLIMNTSQGMVMVTVIAPNVIQVNLAGCMLQGNVSGSTATAKAMAAMPACKGVNSATIQAK